MDHHHGETTMRSPHDVIGHGGREAMSMHAMVHDMRNRFLVAAVLSVPILLWSSIGRQVLHFGPPAPFGLRDDVFQLVLSLPVIGYSARRPGSFLDLQLGVRNRGLPRSG